MNWNQYSKRRGKMSLQDFLIGRNSKQEALDLFASMNVEPPLELLDKLFDIKNPEQDQVLLVQTDETPKQEEISDQNVISTKKSKVSSGSTSN